MRTFLGIILSAFAIGIMQLILATAMPFLDLLCLSDWLRVVLPGNDAAVNTGQ